MSDEILEQAKVLSREILDFLEAKMGDDDQRCIEVMALTSLAMAFVAAVATCTSSDTREELELEIKAVQEAYASTARSMYVSPDKMVDQIRRRMN